MLNTKYRFYILLTFTLIICGVFIHATLTEEDKQQREFETYYKIYSLAAPNKLVFAGEAVPLLDFDVQERYDREILTNVYWQSQTLLMIKRAYKYFPMIEPILAQNGIPDDMKYLVLAESGLQNVVSPAGASGYWQILEGTAKNYGLEISAEVDERYHIEKSTQAACLYFKEAYKVFNSWSLVAASYNMGIDGVRKQLQQQGVSNYYDLLLNTETSRYVFRIIALKEVLQNPKAYGYIYHFGVDAYPPQNSELKMIPLPIYDLALWAKENNTNYKTIRSLNPWIRGNKITSLKATEIQISVPMK